MRREYNARDVVRAGSTSSSKGNRREVSGYSRRPGHRSAPRSRRPFARSSGSGFDSSGTAEDPNRSARGRESAKRPPRFRPGRCARRSDGPGPPGSFPPREKRRSRSEARTDNGMTGASRPGTGAARASRRSGGNCRERIEDHRDEHRTRYWSHPRRKAEPGGDEIREAVRRALPGRRHEGVAAPEPLHLQRPIIHSHFYLNERAYTNLTQISLWVVPISAKPY